MEMFNNEYFELLNKMIGKKGSRDDDEYKKLKEGEELTKKWATAVCSNVFPDGDFDNKNKPTNQANNYKGYTWARLYPNKNSNKSLAYTIGVDHKFGFVVKIDTVNASKRLRHAYEAERGEFSTSKIVKIKSIDEGINSGFDGLVSWAVDAINSLTSFYDYLIKKLPLDTAKPDQDESDAPESDDSKHHGRDGFQNTILFGPPGTGKTYNTINHALKILEPSCSLYKREELIKKFKEYVNSGQIVFTTFHQSYGYEEFIEGIKPDMDASESGEVRYTVEDGVFKKLCITAQLPLTENNFHEKIEWLKSQCSELDGKEPLDLGGFTISYRDGRTFRVKPKKTSKDNADYPASIQNIEKLYKGCERKDVYNPTYVSGILDYLFKNGLDKFDFSKKTSDLKYVIIIDEINRGNISKIFGELITLIEPSKRIGAEEELRVSLPYSGNEFDGGKGFGVPSNVYIIGTMNTADRSIALMDTALRRRFEFIEMMPDYKVLSTGELSKEEAESDQENSNDLKVGEINIRLLLKKINERISYLYDRDHQIGHAYFMSLNDEKITDNKAELDSIFKNKIIPLLQEYFYDDWEKIQIVLGDHDGQFDKLYKQLNKDHRFIISESLKEADVLGFDHEPTEESKISYRVNAKFTPQAYLKITGQLSSDASGNTGNANP